MELTGETPWKAVEIWWNMGWKEGLGWFRVETSFNLRWWSWKLRCVPIGIHVLDVVHSQTWQTN
jgi:hypothetical protein